MRGAIRIGFSNCPVCGTNAELTLNHSLSTQCRLEFYCGVCNETVQTENLGWDYAFIRNILLNLKPEIKEVLESEAPEVVWSPFSS
jgi:hypothetical protein